MAITREEVAKLYVATFNRAPLADGLDYWADENLEDNGWTIEMIAESFFDQEETQELYPEDMSSSQLVIAIFDNLFGRLPAVEGLEYWTEALDTGAVSRGEMVLAIASGAQDTEDYNDASILANKTEVGLYYADAGGTATDYDLSDITDDDDTVSEAMDQIDATLAVGSDVYLTDGQDFLIGSNDNETFIARGNSSLDNADVINGLGGIDTVEVMLDEGETAESPLLTNVEILKVQAQEQIISTGDNDIDGQQGVESNIDAGDMSDVEQYWSDNSRADLVIEDVSHNSHETTIVWKDSDPGVDYRVYFDPENITNGNEAGGLSSVVFDMINVYQLQETGEGLDGFSNLTFQMDGTDITVNIIDEDGNQVINTYDALADAIADAIDAAGFDADVTVMEEETAFFPIDVADYEKGQETTRTYNPILITSDTADITVVTGETFGYDTNYDATYSAFATTATVNQEADVPALTSVEVILDRVGRDDNGGELEIGSDSINSPDGVHVEGIQQFNVLVDRDSHLDLMESTENYLEVINVENINDDTELPDLYEEQGDGTGDLIIDSIVDVRVFDASEMIGDVTLGATLTGAIVSKYLDLVDDNDTVHGEDNDDGHDAGEDNSELDWADVIDNEFSYDFGEGDDSLDLSLALTNTAFIGTTTREDFVLEINGGDGDDELSTTITTAATDDTDHWYLNSKQNANMTVNGGEGDDVIRTRGAGDFIIDGGDDSDTIYTDNSGSMAQWAFNAETDGQVNINNLDSQDDASVSAVNAFLTVTFKGFESEAIEIADSYDARTNVAITDLDVNQAIKTAINDDPVLSTLLIAQDGPGNTLIVTSLIDGDQTTLIDGVAMDDQLVVTFDNEELTNGQAALANPVTLFEDDLAGYDALVDGYTTDQTLFNGIDSVAASDNTINGGEADNANDVIVLGTDSNSNDTVVYSGFNNGTDSIVNFETQWQEMTEATDKGVDLGETVIVRFTDAQAAAAGSDATITFDGVTVNLDAVADQGVAPAEDVAFEFVEQYNADGDGNYTATWVEDTGVVRLVANEFGDIDPDVVAGDFTIENTNSTVNVLNVIDGSVAVVEGVHESITIDFDGSAADSAGQFTFDDITVNYVQGDGSITLANAIEAAGSANWGIVNNNDGTITLTAIESGDFDQSALAAGNYEDTFGGFDNIFADVIVTEGTEDRLPVTTLVQGDADYLDFSDYDAVGVYVGSTLVAGDAVDSKGDQYVRMIESATNDGSYTIALYESADAAFGSDTKIGTIGVADFGEEQAFIEQNFII